MLVDKLKLENFGLEYIENEIFLINQDTFIQLSEIENREFPHITLGKF